MQLNEIVLTWEVVRATRSRIKKVAAVGALLDHAAADDAAPTSTVVSYLSGELPQGRIGMGPTSVHAVDVAAAPVSTLALADLDATFDEIKTTSGAGSKRAKDELLTALFGQATAIEQDFIRRLLLGGLRQGALEGIMTEAVAQAADVPAPLVRRAAMLTGDLAAIADQAMRGGAEALQAYSLQLFTAVQPMLASSAPTATEAVDRAGRAVIEWKIDGARVQVHRDGGRVAVYTRNLRDITSSSPDLVAAVQALDVQSIILDGEAVALSADARPVPFQETISRFASDDGGDLDMLFFDCLHLNGVDLIDLPGAQRWSAMATVLPPEMQIPRIETDDPAEAEAFFDDAIVAGHEGVMVKSLEALYEAGRRGAGWIKVKPVHTFDLVVLAVEWGSGRRSGWLSNIHLGARDPANPGEFIMVGKTFKGMTDDILRWQTERFLALEARRDRHVIYVRPEQVVEIAIDGVQHSPRYPGDVALRFARVKTYRDDKSPAEADTIDQLKKLL